MIAGGGPARGGAAGDLAASLDLIHRNNCSNQVSMRVAKRFEGPNLLPMQSFKAPCPLSFLMGWRAANGTKSRT